MNDVVEQFNTIVIRAVYQTSAYSTLQKHTRADVWLTDGSRLIAQEYNYFDTGRTKYSYQWMTHSNQLIHRWDNAHEVSGIYTSPHHQHIGSDDNIHPSEAMTLEKVLAFISQQISA